MPYYSEAYGLVFGSTFPLPELTPLAPERVGPPPRADVTVVEGHVPDHLSDPLQSSEFHEANGTRFLLRIEGVANYLVTGGSEIIIEPVPASSAHERRVFMLGTCLGVLLHQRGFLVLHASGIATEGGAVLFAGESGAGKSTLLAAMLRRGAKMVVDDVCAVTRDDRGAPVVVPSYPRTRLWAETAAQLGVDVQGLPRTRPSMEKFERQLPQQFWDRAEPLRRVFLLEPSDETGFSRTRSTGFEAFQTILQHTYRGVLLDGLARLPDHFELASLVAKLVPVVRVRRPRAGFQLEELADLIDEDLREPHTELEQLPEEEQP